MAEGPSLTLLKEKTLQSHSIWSTIFEKTGLTPSKTLERQEKKQLHRPCPFVPHHVVPATSLHRHSIQCILRLNGIENEKDPKVPSSIKFYSKSDSILSIFRKYEAISESEQSQSAIKLAASLMFGNSTYSFLKELEFWDSIPSMFTDIGIHNIPPESIKGWLLERLPYHFQSQNVSFDPLWLFECVETMYHSCLSLPRWNSQNIETEMEKLLSLGKETKVLIVELWKFVLQLLMTNFLNVIYSPYASHYLGWDNKVSKSEKGKGMFELLVDQDSSIFGGGVLSSAEDIGLFHCLAQNKSRHLPQETEYEEAMNLARQWKEESHRAHKSKHDDDKQDYKRRRKTYRAKNVRITKRTATQIHADLIKAYFEDLSLLDEFYKMATSKSLKLKF